VNELDHLNTLGVSARADRLVAAHSLAQLRRVVLEANQAGQSLLILGGGSNLVMQRHFAGTVCLMKIRGLRVESLTADRFAVSAGAGERWHSLVRYCLGQGLYGLENLALIPGSVGAAPLQNIGAYGVELADRLLSLKAMDTTTGEVREFDRDACRFSYRDSLFKSIEPERYVIVEVTLQLTGRPRPVIGYPDIRLELARLGYADPSPVQVAEAVIKVRRRKLPDPKLVGNVGSFFKNPVVSADQVTRLGKLVAGLVARKVNEGGTSGFKLSAAQLIDRAGWKGVRRGAVAVWSRQPLVLINVAEPPNSARGVDFLALSEEIRADILGRFGVTLELEPRVVGDG
jgi:UDP-N-acetylmuramate dehydrogenase